MKRTTGFLLAGVWLLALTGLAACSKDDSSTAGQQSAEPAVAAVAPEPDLAPPVAQLDQPVAPLHYALELRIDPREPRFSGTVAIDIEASESVSGFWLHGKGLDVSEAWLADAAGSRIEAAYEQRHPSGVARITPDTPVGPGTLTLHLNWSAPFSEQPNALFRVERGGDAYAATQFEPIAARQVFPGFDEPGFKVPFDITLISPTDQVTITNTPERAAEDLGDGFTRHQFETTRPLPTYLIAFAVGPYDLVDFGDLPPNGVRDHGLPLRAIAARGQGQKLDYALQHTAGVLGSLEDYFGTAYPFRKLDLIAVPTSFGGAMENAGAITYDEYLLLMDESAALDQRRAYTSVHAHELGHMWFGDLVTPVWWDDIWLNESFATWIAYKAAQNYWPEGEFDRSILRGALGAMSEDSLAAARQIREPVDNNDSISDAFDSITYQKGGGVLAMLERYVGEEEFRKGIQLHLDRYAEGVADAPRFIESVAEGSGRPEIAAAFHSYIEQPGVPLLDVQVNCAEGQAPSLQVTQSRYAPLGSSIDPAASQWLVPMCIEYQDGGASKSECVMLQERQQNVPLDADNCPSALHPNADGAGYYRFSLDESWWQGLIAGLPEMAPAEALVVADSLDAAFRANRVSAATYVEGMTALLNHPAWDVVAAGMDNLEVILNILQADELPPVEAALGALAAPRYGRLADESGDAAELLNSRMQRFMTVVARIPEYRAPLAAKAAQRIGIDGEPDPDAVPQSELETVLSIGVQDFGAPFFERLLQMAEDSEDRAFRNAALGALARVEDPVLAARLQEVMLSGQLQGYEPLTLLARQMARTATTELTYAWLRENFDRVLPLIPETFRGQWVPGLGANFCSAERAAEWSDFITSHASELPGYERSLAQATESANLCAALREAQAQPLMAALEN